ncbi:MAG: CsbD family protein [Rudaea sp.]
MTITANAIATRRFVDMDFVGSLISVASPVFVKTVRPCECTAPDRLVRDSLRRQHAARLFFSTCRLTKRIGMGNLRKGRNEVKSAVKEVAGKATGNRLREAEGNIEKKAGKVQNAVGKAADKARDELNKCSK